MVRGHLEQLADGLSKLLSGHFELFRLELKEDARAYGSAVGGVLAFSGLLVMGYGFLCLGLALALGRWVPLEIAVLGVALANVVAGLAGVRGALRRFERSKLMDDSLSELSATRALGAEARRAGRSDGQ